MTDEVPIGETPRAVLKPERRLSWAWLLPVAAVVFAGWLGWQSWRTRGVAITVQLDQGYGLRPGDEVRYRGIAVGFVRSVELANNVDGVLVRAELTSQAHGLARSGSRFWVVRPQFGITGVAGLETVIGPRYLAMLPGEGPRQRQFVGLSQPPAVESIEPGDLEIVLESARRGSVSAGAPVLYRQVPVGTVLSVGLTSDGGAVEARVHIRKAYTPLIRSSTRFWKVGGLEARVGLGGVSFEMESVEALLAGGVALATPPEPGEVVRTGHRFNLFDRPQENWLEWQPLVAIGSSFLPAGSPSPSPLRAVLDWKEGRWFKSSKSRRGWLLQTDRGLLGPADLLIPGEGVDPASVVLEVTGKPIPLTKEPLWTDGRLALIEVSVTDQIWPKSLQRTPDRPEDSLAVADPASAPLPLASSRLIPADGVWAIDPAVSVDPSWHGASVLTREDGKLVGLVLVTEDGARVALLPGGE